MLVKQDRDFAWVVYHMNKEYEEHVFRSSVAIRGTA
jgi:hypothetical protein